MEFLLQWLDELDDLTAAVLFIWHRVSALCLFTGMAAAILVHADQVGNPGFLPVYLLAQIALTCVAVWGLGGLVSTAFDQRLTDKS